MARIRSVKPELWTSEQVIACSPIARLLFIGLWNFSDDAGVHPASYVRLKAEIFPCDSFTIDEIKAWINELINNNLLSEYVVEDKTYWHVLGWQKHQRIDKPNYRHPLPQRQLKSLADTAMINQQELDDNSPSSRRIVADTSPINRRPLDEHSPPDSNGREWIGKEEHKYEVETSPLVAPENSISASVIKSSPEELEIFKCWQLTMQHPRSKLDKNRRNKIRQALAMGYSIEELKTAIAGCAKTPFNIGINERGQHYDSIDLIFRDADHIDRFIANAITPPSHDKKYVKPLIDLNVGAI